VLAATDGAPASWVGTRVEECADAPVDLKAAADAMLARALHDPPPVSDTVTLQSLELPATLTVIDALPIHRVPIDLRALLCSSLDALQRQAKAADVTLKIVVDRHVPPIVRLDPDKIAWATTALVGNALRYVRHGSFTMPSGAITVRAAYNPAGPDVTIEVQDDGAGIPADKLRLLFSAELDRPRVGLGLLMVREVVAAHGGHVEAHSDTAAFMSGTTIRLTLPVG
jgi:signal transduction histidine kinase